MDSRVNKSTPIRRCAQRSLLSLTQRCCGRWHCHCLAGRKEAAAAVWMRSWGVTGRPAASVCLCVCLSGWRISLARRSSREPRLIIRHTGLVCRSSVVRPDRRPDKQALLATMAFVRLFFFLLFFFLFQNYSHTRLIRALHFSRNRALDRAEPISDHHHHHNVAMALRRPWRARHRRRRHGLAIGLCSGRSAASTTQSNR
jgi:hypothetical protein